MYNSNNFMEYSGECPMKTESPQPDHAEDPENSYRQLRNSTHEKFLIDTVHEDSDRTAAFQLNERFLQILWNENRFLPDMLTVTGRPVKVLSPGRWNVENGPDFLDASLKIGDREMTGDVEIHRRPSDWISHGHDGDKRYDRVILHTVWHSPGDTPIPSAIPCLEMCRWIDESWRALLEEFRNELYPYARQIAPGSCAVKWAVSANKDISGFLRAAGMARFHDKVTRVRRGAITNGFGQSIYEMLFDALGYKANREPFRRLAQHVPIARLRELEGPLAWEAALFGSAGFLPDPTVTRIPPEWEKRVKELWDEWWRLGLVPASLTWSRGSSRPYNSPERRLAAGIELLRRSSLYPDKWLMDIAKQAKSPAEMVRKLTAALTFKSHWDARQTFTSPLSRPGQLLGRSRRLDIITNVILPFIAARAQTAGNERITELAEKSYRKLPKLQDNRPLKEAIHRFFVPPSLSRELLTNACRQQGLLEIYGRFCLSHNSDCQKCALTGILPVA